MSASRRRAFLVPEVPQIGALDCGPAALAAVLQGFGLAADCDELRDACRTGRDGTSIDALEAVAIERGLLAEQILLPADDPTFAPAACAPCILVVERPGGLPHFVVLWRLHRRRAQLMDPAAGRCWPRLAAVERDIYRHRVRVPAAAWRAWAGSPGALQTQAARLAALGLPAADRRALVGELAATSDWWPLATLAAAARFTRQLAAAGAVRRGREANRLLRVLLDRLLAAPPGAPPPATLPASCWTVWPAPPTTADGPEHLLAEGAVLVRFSAGTTAMNPNRPARPRAPAKPPNPAPLAAERARGPTLSVTVAAVAATTGAVLARCAGAVWVVGTFLRLDASAAPPPPWPAASLLLSGCALAAIGLVFEATACDAAETLGRQRETHLRLRFLASLPHLPDRYLRTRQAGDLADRAHRIAGLRRGPRLALAALAAGLDGALAIAGTLWLDPGLAPRVLAAAAGAVAGPLVLLPRCEERDRRARAGEAALSAAVLDALRGATALRAHAAEWVLERRYADLLAGWSRARRAADAAGTWLAAGTQGALALAAGALVLGSVDHRGAGPRLLLLALAASRLASAGQRLAVLAARDWPQDRSLRRGLDEVFAAARAAGATAEATAAAAVTKPVTSTAPSPGTAPTGATIAWQHCAVECEGRWLLQDLDLAIAAGQHVAILGASGAGKSTLLATLLGWYPVATGSLQLDGHPLDATLLRDLRRTAVWCAPEVTLWRGSWLANLGWGRDLGNSEDPPIDPPAADLPPVEALRQALLLDRLRDGGQGFTEPLDEGGQPLSGGEAQRLRLARALARPGVRLALLDEPCRGLPAEPRRELLARARERWRQATLLCVTHSPAEAADFDRLVILDHGRLVEDGAPLALARQPASRYRALLDAEAAAEAALAAPQWRHIELASGRLYETGRPRAR